MFLYWRRRRKRKEAGMGRRGTDVMSLTPVSWQSSAIFFCGRISTIECWTW
jgi:hypothetical protein